MTSAPATNELLALADELRERTAIRYAGDCKCGGCQLVPRGLLDRVLSALRAAATSAQGAEVSVEELAREMIRADGNTVTTSNENWPCTVAFHEEMRAEYPDYENGYSLVTDAFRRARALLGKYRMEKR